MNMTADYFITGKTKILCLIGYPVEHSFSPIMHNAVIQELGIDYVYIALPVKPENLRNAILGIKALGIVGFNITIPHKERIIQYLDELDPIAEKIGAVNTVKNIKNKLVAKNTDAEGAKLALEEAGCSLRDKNILIIGAGGAARAISFALAEKAKKIVILNRTEIKAIKIAEELNNYFKIDAIGLNNSIKNLKNEILKADILINTTPLGMYPKIEESPVPKEFLRKDLFVFDIVYNPIETKLLKNAKEVGCKTLGGLDMLINQGAIAFEWWIGKKPNKSLMKNKIMEYLGIR